MILVVVTAFNIDELYQYEKNIMKIFNETGECMYSLYDRQYQKKPILRIGWKVEINCFYHQKSLFSNFIHERI